MSRMVAIDDLLDAHDVAEMLGLSHPNTVSVNQHRYQDTRPVIDLGRGAASSSGCVRRSRTGRLNMRRGDDRADALLLSDILVAVFAGPGTAVRGGRDQAGHDLK
jgi:hypothetical protein